MSRAGHVWPFESHRDYTLSSTTDPTFAASKNADVSVADASIQTEAWAGEVRVNMIRLVALTAFYSYHLLHVFAISDDPTLPGSFHQTVSLVVFTWATGAV